ncbi:MAG: hypothetical protein INR70_11315 [Parafilimonas terrae]|nr:hypothetical protein [Parafilimonas terrae]
MRTSDNVVQLRRPSAQTQAVARVRPEPERGILDVFLVGGLLTGLAFTGQQLVLALSVG